MNHEGRIYRVLAAVNNTYVEDGRRISSLDTQHRYTAKMSECIHTIFFTQKKHVYTIYKSHIHRQAIG